MSGGNRLSRIAAVFECILVTLWSAWRASAVQSTPAVRQSPNWFFEDRQSWSCSVVVRSHGESRNQSRNQSLSERAAAV
jgi:hypothetical protein